jgi:hypothetical protein
MNTSLPPVMNTDIYDELEPDNTPRRGYGTAVDVQNLYKLEGGSGGSGVAGREVELRATDTYIQWRYVGDSSWTNLVALDNLRGPQGYDGRAVEMRASDTHIQWRYVGDAIWNNLVALADISGTDGVVITQITEINSKLEELEQRVDSVQLEWEDMLQFSLR